MAEIPQPVVGAAALALVVIGAYITYKALGKLQRGWIIWQSDPINAGDVEYENGIVEVQGEVEQLEDELLTTKYTDTPAVVHEYKLQVHEENRTGDQGTEWETVDSGTEAQPFYVTDETGSVAVDPDGATVSLDVEKVSGGSEIDIGPVDASTSKRYEGLLPPGEHVHVFGQKRDAQGDGLGSERCYIGDGGETDTFSISDTTETRTIVRYIGGGLSSLILGLAALAVGGILALVLLGQLEFSDIGLQMIPL
ncbi:E3 ubiquitin ligase family protein (plasmid) [Haloplanus ruber]|uniref:RING-type E3 ubiquitin transferase n=1 Tax=Haloplanus ruber TaxID=869892 RepID=A0ABD6CW88_9EURY|nr:E3 ubiquitin ligase family protein [Haloplanus ruber]